MTQRVVFEPMSASVKRQIKAERFGIWLALEPLLNELRALAAPGQSDADGDEPGHLVEGAELHLIMRRIDARLESIGQGLHRK